MPMVRFPDSSDCKPFSIQNAKLESSPVLWPNMVTLSIKANMRIHFSFNWHPHLIWFSLSWKLKCSYLFVFITLFLQGAQSGVTWFLSHCSLTTTSWGHLGWERVIGPTSSSGLGGALNLSLPIPSTILQPLHHTSLGHPPDWPQAQKMVGEEGLTLTCSLNMHQCVLPGHFPSWWWLLGLCLK